MESELIWKPKDILLETAGGSSHELSIQGALTREDIPKELFYPAARQVRLVVPQAVVRSYSWYCAPSDVEGFIAYSNDVPDNMFPSDEASSYMDEGFNTRVYEVDEYAKVMNIAIILIP